MISTTDTSEKGLETLIVKYLTSNSDTASDSKTLETSPEYAIGGYVQGRSEDFDRDHAVDIAKLQDFVGITQPKAAEALDLYNDSPQRNQFLHRLQGEIARRGIIDVLRNGVKHGPVHLDVFYGSPTPGNIKAQNYFEANILSVTRQLHYSKDETQLALDLCLFINGLPVATFELKNRLTKQTVDDAVQQYKRDRNPKDLLFQFGRCIVHFAVDDQVVAKRKIGGQARAMVVCGGVQRAIQYYHTISDYLRERKSPYRSLVAFSGEREYGGRNVTEASLNGFSDSRTKEEFRNDPYRFLVVADKFQTGYDEPLLHTMYVDKQLSGVKAVQTLSRLNRADPRKEDAFVLDFMNDADTIKNAFADYYRTTVLSEETDPNKLHDLKNSLDMHRVYAWEQVEDLVRLFLEGAERDTLDPILDECVRIYISDLDEDAQVDFKGKSKAFVRTYQFLSSILPYTSKEWEKLSIFLNFLTPKLPAPVEEDLAKGVLESIDMESYRSEKRETIKLSLEDRNGEVDPVPPSGGGHMPEPELDHLSNIIKAFNEQWGNIEWDNSERIQKAITEDIPNQVASDRAYQNAMKNNDKSAARLEHDRALGKVILAMLSDDTELYKQFSDNPDFKKWLSDINFHLTYTDKAG